MVVLDGCYFIRLVGFWLGYAKVSFSLNCCLKLLGFYNCG
ncbi:hypothetical protein [uncultured Gammaproteobacteria bacterium]|nr:hypothetical protein [uncultured Gammaproteobacteria bacterium]